MLVIHIFIYGFLSLSEEQLLGRKIDSRIFLYDGGDEVFLVFTQDIS